MDNTTLGLPVKETEKLTTLQTYLKRMDVPVQRFYDLPWLCRNLGIKNSNHVDYDKAIDIIHELINSSFHDKLQVSLGNSKRISNNQ